MQHRNSLGYTIGQDGDAQIVWGFDSAGNRVGIEEAERGGTQGLICSCGVKLVAKKGEELAHHFAHASGYAKHCEEATKAAAETFIKATLSNAGTLLLPNAIRGCTNKVTILSVEDGSFFEFPIHLVSIPKGAKLRVVSRLKMKSSKRIAEQSRTQGISTFAIDLFMYRNQPDHTVARAIVAFAPRKWLFLPSGQQSENHIASSNMRSARGEQPIHQNLSNKEVMRRLFPDIG